MNSESLEEALKVLGQLLADRGQHHEIVAIGGGALLLLREIERSTKDLDLVAVIENDHLIPATPLPSTLLQAIAEVAKAFKLDKSWLNDGPTSLLTLGLPSGFMSRLHTRIYGGLTLRLASRFDQICFKLYAAVDQGKNSKHFVDLISLRPSDKELETAKMWCLNQDSSENFKSEMNQALEILNAQSD